MIIDALKSFFAAFERDSAEARPFKPEWIVVLEQHIPLCRKLPPGLRENLHRKIAAFVAGTYFEGCGGLELDEEMIITIAGQACFLIMNREEPVYPKLRTVLVYPSTFFSIVQQREGMTIVEREVKRLGESWSNGTVILAWDSVRGGTQNMCDGHNVVLHEFAHQLDQADGRSDGAPLLGSRANYREWAMTLSAEYSEFLEQVEKGRRTVMDHYGATNPAEFFAVLTETFFEKPKQLSNKHPALYEQLAKFYQLDPLGWGDSP